MQQHGVGLFDLPLKPEHGRLDHKIGVLHLAEVGSSALHFSTSYGHVGCKTVQAVPLFFLCGPKRVFQHGAQASQSPGFFGGHDRFSRLSKAAGVDEKPVVEHHQGGEWMCDALPVRRTKGGEFHQVLLEEPLAVNVVHQGVQPEVVFGRPT